MLEAQRSMSQPEKSAITGNFDYQTIASNLLRALTIVCLAYAGLHLEILSDGIRSDTVIIDKLREEYSTLSKQLAVNQADAAANIELLRSQLNFLDYRITLLEARHGQIYTKSDDSPDPDGNTSRMGSKTNIK